MGTGGCPKKNATMDNRIIKSQIKTIIASILLALLCCAASVEAQNFKVASYNVENLFDLSVAGTEYTAYIPDTGYGWTRDIANIKYTNIAGVIKELEAEIVALQEIESKKALFLLRKRLKDSGVDYPYFEIADSRATSVKCAVLSRFPIVKKKEIEVNNKIARNILKVTFDINGNDLILFVNHWKSKQGPESMRIACAKALRREISKLKEDSDFILAGDFNSNYNEYKTFRTSDRLNDTGGITGINHILRTIKGFEIVNEKTLTQHVANEYLYSLWLEVSKRERWSYKFFGKKDTPDNIILPKGLYDNKGISYVDNSFNKFHPDYLLNGSAIYRWQRAKNGKGKHLGIGYSDHLPIFACFSTEPFRFKERLPVSNDITPLKLERSNSPQNLLHLNTAGKEKLMSINGIGPDLSARIIAGRPYKTIDELLKVKGIGPKRLEKFRPFFVISQ